MTITLRGENAMSFGDTRLPAIAACTSCCCNCWTCCCCCCAASTAGDTCSTLDAAELVGCF